VAIAPEVNVPRLNPDALTFGTFTSSYPPVEQVIQSAQGLEAMGFDHVWSGDQLQFQHPHQLWQPDLCDGARTNPKLAAKFALQPLMSVLGQHTHKVCIGQGVLDAIRRGPAILAQEFLTTQHFTQGRAIFALAAGEWKNIGPYGYSHQYRDSRLVETVQLVRAFLETQEPISFDGRFWKLDGAVVELPPYDGVPPPLWVAGGGPKVLEAVGRYADGWLVYTPGGVRGRAELIAERLATARTHAERAGRDPHRLTCGTLPLLLCHPDRDQVERWLDHPFMQWHALTGFPFGEAWRDYGYEHPLGDRYSVTLEGNMATMPLARALELCRQVPRDMVKAALHWGTADDIAPRLIAEVEAGVRHFALCNYVGFISRADAPAATRELLEVARRVRARFPDLAALPPLLG
jgi:phthiodiolone/phenolphthiodiolone dimycocerosates ketoreductase